MPSSSSAPKLRLSLFRGARNLAGALSILLLAAGAQADPLTGALQVAAGDNHACALTSAGGVLCWGKNDLGQLGDGTNTNRVNPVPVSGLASGVAGISASHYHTCAVLATGGVKCWGYNEMGQLGDNSTTNRNVPVDVVGLGATVSRVSVGYQHTCALTTAGGAKCWGRGGMGQLGNGTFGTSYTPVDVSGLGSGVAEVHALGHHTCAVTTGGALKCWGWNYYSQVGDNTATNRNLPTDVSGLGSGIAHVDGGMHHSCAVTTTGAAYCWGNNEYGQLGDSSVTLRPSPVAVTGLASGAESIDATLYHTCVAVTGGGVKCWGRGDAGQIGNGGTANRTSPTDVTGLASGVTLVAAGGNHTCVVAGGGAVKCWGLNTSGELGDGWQVAHYSPGDVVSFTDAVISLVGGIEHTCALTAGGAVKCWGAGRYGATGIGTSATRAYPVEVTGLSSGVTKITAGQFHTCALVGGGVKCWGTNGAGQLGDSTNTTRYAPVDVTGLGSGVVDIAAYYAQTCAVTAAGAVQCWGLNEHGQLGDNTVIDRNAPVAVTNLVAGATKVAVGAGHACAIASGAVQCWGWNVVGQLGDNTTGDRLVPGPVSGLATGSTDIRAGDFHTCVITASGAMKCWGDNMSGQLGDDSTTMRTAPVDVSGIAGGTTGLAAGSDHTCAVVSGGAKCWGAGSYGKLGDGTGASHSIPTEVPGLASGVAAIGAGYGHTCAAPAAGGAKCWGLNEFSQLGDGTLSIRTVPGDVQVVNTAPVIGEGASVSVTMSEDGSPTAFSLTLTASDAESLTWTILSPAGHGVASLPPGAGASKGVGYVPDPNFHGADSFVVQVSDGSLTDSVTVNVTVQPVNDAPTLDAIADPATVPFIAGLQSVGLTGITPGPADEAGQALVASISHVSNPSLFATPPAVTVTGSTGAVTYTGGAAGSSTITVRLEDDGGTAGGGANAVTRTFTVSFIALDPDADYDGDGIPNQVEVNEGRNPLVRDNDIFSPGLGAARLFAMQMYRDFLNREGDAAGIEGWAAAVNAGTWTRVQVIDGFLSSDEFGGFVAPVVRLYFATFLRVPDYNGLMYNAALVRAGTLTPAQLAGFFATSPEFMTMYGSLDNSAFVTLLYDNILGRAPDPAGLAGWVALLDGGTPRGQVLIGFSESAEYRAAMANEVLVTMMYAGMLRRTPEPAGFGGWVTLLDTGAYTREQVIEGFFLSNEFYHRFLP